MQQNYQLILTLSSISLIYSFIYFYIYRENKHRYIAIWGFGWMFYSLGYLLDLFAPADPLTSIFKNLLSIINSFFLLLGTFEFVGFGFPKKYISLCIWFLSFLVILYSLFYLGDGNENMSDLLTLVASLLLSIISVGTGTVFLIHEDSQHESMMEGYKRDITIDITAWIFIIWGLHKGFYNFVTPDFDSSPGYYISSIFLTNVLNIALILVNSAKSNFEITSSERLYRLLAENSRDAIMKIMLFPKQSCVYISPAIQAITGFAEDSFYHDPDFFTNIIHPQDRSRYLDYMNQLKVLDSKIAFRLRRKDQKIIWIEQHSTLVYNEDGTPSSIEAIMRDISDRKQIEESLFNSEISRRQLLANICHELKSPITSIIGYLSVIDDKLIYSPGTYLKYVRTCLEKSLTLNDLIQDLFELSKLEAKQLPFNWEWTNTEAYLKTIFEKYKIDIEKAGVSTRLVQGAQPYHAEGVYMDKRRIEQVFYNVISNALNSIEKDGEIVFRLEAGDDFSWPDQEKSRDDYIVFSVEDNGIGIPPGNLNLIFQRFYKSHQSNAKGGTGLGLAISKEIVDTHEGLIWAESKEQKGTTIYIALPREGVIHGERKNLSH